MAVTSENTATSPASRNALDDGAQHRGWFVGHFVDPAAGLRHSLDIEVKWKHHPAGDRSTTTTVGDWRTTLTLLVQGRFAVWVDGEQTVLERPGDYMIWSPAPTRRHFWQALADSVMLTVRWPSGRDPAPLSSSAL
jgi:hypothetical protein